MRRERKGFGKDRRGGRDRPRFGGGGFGRERRGGGFGGGGFGGERKMFNVVCSDCGKDTEVPFKPTEGRPVYCRECYQKHRKF